MSYNKLAIHFKARTPYKYSKDIVFDGTRIVATERSWEYIDGRWQIKRGTDEIVLAEYIERNGNTYAVVYNRGNKCFATEVMTYGFNNSYRSHKCGNLKYGEIGKPVVHQQRAYKCQLIDALIYSGVISHILIPTTLNGDSKFFELEGI